MNNIDLAYLPIVGRGLQINIICALHNIKVNLLMTKPMGEDFDKKTQKLLLELYPGLRIILME